MDTETLLGQLNALSLSKHEALVYLELLKLGRSNAGPIVKSCSIHRQFVYTALDSLQNKKLVTHFISKNRKVFQASPPSTLTQLIETQRQTAIALVPQLMKLSATNQERIEVRILYGVDDFFRNLETTLKSAATHDGVLRIIGGAHAKDFYRILGRRYDVYKKLQDDLKIKKLLLAPEKGAEVFMRRYVSEKRTELRVVREGLSAPTYTRITEELTTIEIYTHEVMVIQIWSPAVAKGYREHFELLWKRAKKPT